MNLKKIRISGIQIDTAINIAPNSCCSAEHIVVGVGGPHRPGGPPGGRLGAPVAAERRRRLLRALPRGPPPPPSDPSHRFGVPLPDIAGPEIAPTQTPPGDGRSLARAPWGDALSSRPSAPLVCSPCVSSSPTRCPPLQERVIVTPGVFFDLSPRGLRSPQRPAASPFPSPHPPLRFRRRMPLEVSHSGR